MNATLSRSNILYFTVATAGHVDHGKTSLLRALTGIDPDRLKEEKLRGLTIDLGFAHLTMKAEDGPGTVKIGFVDVPGHGKFLKNMLAGVGGIDLALLVVAADEGPMPQTDQHAKILSLLGVRNVLLLITKIDMASTEQRQSCEAGSRALLERYNLQCVAVLPVSSTTREGLEAVAPALLQSLRASIDRKESLEDPVYLPIDRVFSKAGYGTVITGTLVRGTLTTGDNVYIEPGGITARVRGMESFGKPVENAHAGQRLAVNLVLKQPKPLVRGQAIFLAPPTECQNLIAQFDLFDDESAEDLRKALPGQQLRVYHGTAEVAGHLPWAEIVQTKSGSKLIGQISLTEPLIAEPGEKFVARYEDVGVTGGELLVGVRARWLSREKVMPLVDLLLEKNYSAAIQLYIELSPHHLVKADAILAILPLAERLLLSTYLLEGKLVALGEYISTAKAKEMLTGKILDALDKLETESLANTKKKSEDGISLEALRAKTLGHIERSVFQSLIKELVEAGRASKTGDKLVSAKSAGRAVTGQESGGKYDDRIVGVLNDHICLEIKEVARLIDAPLADIQAAIARLGKKGKAFIIAYEFASSSEAVEKAHQVLGKIWAQKREITPSDFKEALGVTRKYAMALLTYFDDHSITRRMANNRVLLKAPKAGSGQN